jgi:uncharacterized protein (UPF0371 family)
MKIGFDSTLYMLKQKEAIQNRIEHSGNKLYLEFGGKLFDDYHAARVLPGFDLNAKVRLLQEFADRAEIIFCINAADIEKNKIRSDIGITYDMDVLRLIDSMRRMGLYVSSIVITQYSGQPGADSFRKMVSGRGVKTYLHYPINGYPADVDLIVSDEGYGANDYVETTRPLVVVTAPGPCSGKLATCLSQLYHENKRGVKAGYAKFETFPIWNLPLKHPVNLAYEAATADLKDVNMIDPFHLDAYGKTCVNYNRDIEVFPVVKTILERIGSGQVYQSPTDMGVNMAAYGIFDDAAVQEAAKQEIIRRYFTARCDYRLGRVDIETAQKIELIMKQLDLTPSMRACVAPAEERFQKENAPIMAVELPDGEIITGKSSNLMHNTASAILNSIKHMAGISDDIHLLSPIILEPILALKKNSLGENNPVLTLKEVLIALSICAATNPTVELALSRLDNLRGCEAHASSMLYESDEKILKSLGINVTCDPYFSTKELYQA